MHALLVAEECPPRRESYRSASQWLQHRPATEAPALKSPYSEFGHWRWRCTAALRSAVQNIGRAAIGAEDRVNRPVEARHRGCNRHTVFTRSGEMTVTSSESLLNTRICDPSGLAYHRLRCGNAESLAVMLPDGNIQHFHRSGRRPRSIGSGRHGHIANPLSRATMLVVGPGQMYVPAVSLPSRCLPHSTLLLRGIERQHRAAAGRDRHQIRENFQR